VSELIDNTAKRVADLKDVIRGLTEGEPLPEVRRRLALVVRQCDATEVAQAEQQLIEQGVPIKRIMDMCDLHAQAVQDVVVEESYALVPPGHPVDTFRRENTALRELAAQLLAALEELASDEGEPAPALAARVRADCALLMDVDKHYQRKEHLLFPFLEKRGITGPSTVMWGKHDQVRTLLGSLCEAVAAAPRSSVGWAAVASEIAEPTIAALESMIVKEERILLPMALRQLTETEWAEVAEQSPQFGYCLADPAAAWPPRASAPTALGTHSAAAGVAPVAARTRTSAESAGALVFPTGALSFAQLERLFATLPVDLTFVDADDRVRFFSEGRNRIFHRAKAVIGRKVQNCHPPASVSVVERILSDFRSGAQDVAEFWIEMHGRFVHIRYFAVRDDDSAYLGTLEVTQDLTRERALQGERRLLQYES
jgi:hypothetical protein